MVQNEQSGFEVPEDTRPPMPPIRTSSATEMVSESSSTDESADLSGDIEAAEATLLKFKRYGREAFLSSKEHADGDEPSV